MLYRVETTCYWNKNLYEKGALVEFADDVVVPEHLVPANGSPEPADTKEQEPTEKEKPKKERKNAPKSKEVEA